MRLLARLGALGALGVGAGIALSFALRAVDPADGPTRVADTDAATATSTTAATGPTEHPNVLLVMVDDLRLDRFTERYLPNLWELAHRSDSVLFDNAFVSNPLCCPSRTTVLTGRYSHTTGVWNNVGEHGGFRAFEDDGDTLAVDFQEAGYRTGLIGKYLNGYQVLERDYVPPGWETWFAVDTGAFYRYGARSGSELLRFGTEPEDHATNVLTEQAVAFLETDDDRPFFLYLAYTAPHFPSKPLPRDIGRFAGEPDWPVPVVEGHSMLESAFSVDRRLREVLDALPEDTVVLFMSDNGVLWGETSAERGELTGKRWPYDASVHVPMFLAGLDHAAAPFAADPADLLVNVDIRVSLLHAAGLTPTSAQEGLDWFDAGYVARDHVLLEQGNDQWAYCGIRTATTLYVRYSDGVEEFYDYRADPRGQRNLAAEDPPDLALRRDQARAECRPTPPGFSWAGAA